MEFSEIYRLYFRDVYYYLRSLCADQSMAEELAQETFTRALRSIEGYDGKKDIRAWLFTIGKNAYLDFCRRNKRTVSLEEIQDGALPDAGPQFTEQLMDRDTAFEIHQFLHAMEEPYKEVFSLRVFGELPFEQIGKLFGKSAGWARVTYYRAKQKILTHMEECDHGKDSL